MAEDAAEYSTGEKKKKHKMTKKEKQELLKTLTRQMKEASRALEFEKAAELRDMIYELEGK